MSVYGVEYQQTEQVNGRVRLAVGSQRQTERHKAFHLPVLQAEALWGTSCVTGSWEVKDTTWAGDGHCLAVVCKPDRAASLSLKFTGTGISAFGMRNSWNGPVGWSLDGGAQQGIIDEYTATGHVFQDTVLKLAGLADGPHELRIFTLNEGYQKHSPWWQSWQFWLDYFIVEGFINDERLASVQGQGWRVIDQPDCKDGTALELTTGGCLQGWFQGDAFSLTALCGAGQGRLRCKIDGQVQEVDLSVPSKGVRSVLNFDSLPRNGDQWEMTHRYEITALKGTCLLDQIQSSYAKPVEQGFLMVDVPDYPAGRKLGVVLQECYIFNGTAITAEALDSQGEVLASGDKWYLDLGSFAPGEIRRVRFRFSAGDFPRSPELEAYHLLSAPAQPVALPELPLVGHDCGTEKEIIEATRNELGNFCWLPKPGTGCVNHWRRNPKVDLFLGACHLSEHGVAFMISQRRGLGDFIRPVQVLENWAQDTTPDIYSDEEIAVLRTLGGEGFLGLFMEEMDTSMIQGALRQETIAEFSEFYNFTDRRGGRLAYQNEIARYVERAHRQGCRALVNCGVSYQFATYRAGADMVLTELQCYMLSNGPQLAYFRGASRQFGKPFGAWVSLWHDLKLPGDDPDLREWNQGVGSSSPDTGFSVDEMRRSFYHAYYSGAQIVVPQDSVELFTDFDRDGRWETSRWGDELKRFYQYTREHPAGTPVCPVALMIDQDCGSAPTCLWQGFPSWNDGKMFHGNRVANVWGTLPPERCDLAQKEIMRLVWPDYDAFGEQKYPPTFVDTPLGPVDVVESDISLNKLKAYKSIIICGYFNPPPSLIEILTAYVKGGGKVYANAAQFVGFPEVQELWGGTIGTTIRETTSYSIMRTLDGQPAIGSEVSGSASFNYYSFQPSSAATLVTAGDGAPILVENTLGQGKVYLSLTEWGLNDAPLESSCMLPCDARMLKDFIRMENQQVVGVQWHPGLDYLPFVQSDGMPGILLMNNGDEPIETRIKWPGLSVGSKAINQLDGTVHELRSESDGGLMTTLSLGPRSAAVLDVQSVHSEQSEDLKWHGHLARE